MLILTRRVGETVMIGNEVTVTIQGIKKNQVRVGINAPKEVGIFREEIYERIKRNDAMRGGNEIRSDGNTDRDADSHPGLPPPETVSRS